GDARIVRYDDARSGGDVGSRVRVGDGVGQRVTGGDRLGTVGHADLQHGGRRDGGGHRRTGETAAAVADGGLGGQDRLVRQPGGDLDRGGDLARRTGVQVP